MIDSATGRGMEGKAVLVTGGGSGIGLGCAQRLCSSGAEVTICGRVLSFLDARLGTRS